MTDDYQEKITTAAHELGQAFLALIPDGTEAATVHAALCGLQLMIVGRNDETCTPEQRKAEANFIFSRALDITDLAGVDDNELVAAIIQRDVERAGGVEAIKELMGDGTIMVIDGGPGQ